MVAFCLVAALAAVVVLVVAQLPAVDPSTEFFLETAPGEPFRAEHAVAAGGVQSLSVVTRNGEAIGRNMVINLTVWRAGTDEVAPASALESPPFFLGPGGSHRFNATFQVPDDADRAEIRLLVDPERTVYRTLIVRY